MMRIEGLFTPEETATAARSHLYRLLVQGIGYPDRPFFVALTGGVFRREVTEACLALPYAPPSTLEGLTAGGAHVDFQAEYLRLFEVGAGSPPCPLYSGLYSGGRKAVMEELARFYNYFGLSIERGGGELPDHLTTELEFMHFLSFKELWMLHNSQDASPYRRAQVDFLHRQLLPWLPRLQARLEALEPPAFYPALIATIAAFIAADVAYLRALAGGDERLTVQSVSGRTAGGDL